MKHLVLIRHAKAVPYGYENDFERDLRDRGNNDAMLVSEELKKLKILPVAMFSSPARRALKTAQIFAGNLNFSKENIRQVEEIYFGMTTSEFLNFVKEIPDDIETAFIFGHNPAFFYFVHHLLDKFEDEMPTTSTVGIDFNVESWKEITAHSGKKAYHLIPKMLK